MKKFIASLTLGLVLACTAVAHGPPNTPVDPGPVPDILFDYPVLAVFPDLAALSIEIRADTSLSYVENNYTDMSQSVNSAGTWTWANNDFCMSVDDHIVCFELEDELTPGLIYETTMVLLAPDGEEEATLPVKWMLVR